MLYLGIDGGQSSTVAVIGDREGTILGRGIGGPSDHVNEPGGVERLKGAIVGSVSQALKKFTELELSQVKFESAFCGMTGDPREQRQIIAELVKAEHLSVEHDSITALAGATAGGPGIVVIAGTGSVAFGVNSKGEGLRVGGWGYLFGDEGSAFDIARRGVMACLKYQDGRAQKTSIQDKMLSQAAARDLQQLIKAVYSGKMSRDKLASLALCVEAAARDGDQAARDILRSGAEELADMVAALFRRLGGFGDKVKVCYVGGVFNSRFVLEWFEKKLKGLIPSAEVSPPRFEPAVGALLLAYKDAGLFPNKGILDNIEKSLGRSA